MIYLDSSTLFSLHGKDEHSAAATALLQHAREPLVLTPLVELEVVNALCLRLFRKEVSQQQVWDSIGDLELNLRRGVFRSFPLPDSAFSRARVLAQSLTPAIGVRAADLLHVAAAIELGATSLFTFDKRQHQTARTAGLKVNSLP